MYLVREITSEARQKHEIKHPVTGIGIDLTVEYNPMQYAWFCKVKYESFEVNGIRMCTSPNLLRQFKNLIPFGIACTVDENQEPLLQEDFSSARAKVYILDRDEVDEVEDLINE